MRLRLTRDWMLECEASVATSHLSMQTRQGGGAELSRGAAGLSGRFQMIDQQAYVQEAWVQMPGAEVRASGPALVFDGNQVVRSNMAGVIEDAVAFRAALAGLGVKLPADLEAAGRGGFEVHVDRQRDALRIDVHGHGEELAAYWPGVFQRKAGTPLEVQAVCKVGDDGSMVLETGQVRLLGGSITAAAEVGSVASESSRAFALRQARAQVQWDDLEALWRKCPLPGRSWRRWGLSAGRAWRRPG